MANENTENLWTPQDEGDHFPVELEWWCTEGIFKSLENNKNWSFKTVFSIGKKGKEDHLFLITLFDVDQGTYYTYRFYEEPEKFKHEKNKVDVECNGSFLKGLYPDYSMHLHDKKNNIILDLKFKAETLPHWISHEITDGALPMGLGFYRYGFIPNCKLSGTMKIKDEIFTTQGKGYVEHIWGEWLYSNPLSQLKELKKTIPIYGKLGKWWLSKNKIHIPESITFCTENNPFGYDWVWAVFDNGWSLFYGNIMFWIMDGPSMGTLYLTPDRNTYLEFGKISFHYNKMRRSKNYDFYYPSDLEIIAEKGEKKLKLRFTMKTETYEHITKLTKGKYWLAFVICEAVGTVEGYYSDRKNKTKLKGACRIEPQRQISLLGHNSLKIDFLLPPKGVGIDADFNSHYLKKRIKTRLYFAPRPSFKFNMKKLKEKDYSKL